MNDEIEEKRTCSVWIDRHHCTVSFQSAEGFEEVVLSTHDEMFSFVIEKSESGYRIQ